MQCSCGFVRLLAVVSFAAIAQAYEEELEQLVENRPSLKVESKPSLKDRASALLERLQQIDGRLTKYFNIVYRSSLTHKGEDVLEETQIAEKRQASSGAQICIWKVCPPSPWRRTGRSHNKGG